MKNIKKIFGVICALILLTSLFAGLFENFTVKAASKKTVRVTTQKELKKALKNSKVGTIILRTQIYDDFTISSKKAKKKNLIVDAENANIVNKSKFKSIEIINAKKYTEDVSGNTITCGISGMIIAEGRSVKKLTFSYLISDYVLRKGASIKTLAYDIDGKKSSFDKKTGTLTAKVSYFSFETGDYCDVTYKVIIDETGKITKLTYADPEGNNYVSNAEYDENGNMIFVDETNAKTGDITFRFNYEYDKDNNLVSQHSDYGTWDEDTTFEYNSKGLLISRKSVNSVGTKMEWAYKYDSKGRMSESDYSYSSDSYSSSDTTKETYDKNGYKTKTEMLNDTGYKCVYTYKYDSEGNQYYYTLDETYIDGTTATYEYKYEFDEWGVLLAGYIKYPYDDEWIDMSELGD